MQLNYYNPEPRECPIIASNTQSKKTNVQADIFASNIHITTICKVVMLGFNGATIKIIAAKTRCKIRTFVT